MLFNSAAFLVFLPIVYLLYRQLSHIRQNQLLLVSSYIFYGWWDWRFCLLLFASTVMDYNLGRWIAGTHDPSTRRKFLLATLGANLGILGFFKYFNFFADEAVKVLNSLGMEADPITLNVILPVGVSFYTFQSLSYTIDIYRGQCKPADSFLSFATFVALFPQLVAGPIERAVDLIPQVERPRTLRWEQSLDGLWLMLLGYVKKVVIADRCSRFVEVAFAGDALPAEGAFAWTYVYAFALQIYGDFSGYTDIARGVAKLLGFEFTRNFRAPYLVTNPSEFWRHWHISLSSWLRDYLYIPLGGNKKGTARTYFNLMTTMVLGGLWHGAGWAYLIWGFYHGMLLILHRPAQAAIARFSEGVHGGLRLVGRVVGIVVFFHLTCIGWLIFRAGALPKGVDQKEFIFRSLRELFLAPAPEQREAYVVALLGFGLLTLIIQLNCDLMERFRTWRPFWQVGATVAAVLLIITGGVFGGAQFIYFQF